MYRVDKCSGTTECKEYMLTDNFDEAIETADEHLNDYLAMVAVGDGDFNLGIALLVLAHDPPKSVSFTDPEPDGLLYDAWVPMKAPFEHMPSPRMRVYQTS